VYEVAPDAQPDDWASFSAQESRSQAHRAYQPPLFQTRVVSFEAFSPESVEPPTKRRSASRPKKKRAVPGQGRFEFDTVISQPVIAASAVEPVIFCDSPVALQVHRLIAAAFDLSMIFIAVGLFLLIFYVAGGQIVLNKQTIPLCVGIASVFYLFYETLWCLADGDTAGMRLARLRLVNFDGRTPDREQRLYRMAAGFLSVLSLGLGVLWSLVDEEALTWHDHMSKTFPTPDLRRNS
jgi:uncharacterized RDD family membrane protein YckC